VSPAPKPNRWVCEHAGGWAVYEGPDFDPRSRYLATVGDLVSALNLAGLPVGPGDENL